MKTKKIPETFLIPETLGVSYVEMQDMYAGNAQRSRWPAKGIAVWQQPSWSATLSMLSRWLVQPSHRVTSPLGLDSLQNVLIHHLILLSLSHFHRILPSHPLFPRLQPSQDPNLSLAHPNREASPLIRFRCPCITFLSHHQLSILPCIVWDYCQCTPSRSLPHRGPSMAQCSTLHLAVPPAILA